MPKKAILTEQQIKFAHLLINEGDTKSPSECAYQAGYKNRPRQSASELCNSKIYPLVANYIKNLREEVKLKDSINKSNKTKRDCLFKLSYIDVEHQFLGNSSTAQKRIEMGRLLAKRHI